MRSLTIIVDGKLFLFRGDVDTLECEETAGGTLNLRATFPPVAMSAPPGCTLLDGTVVGAA